MSSEGQLDRFEQRLADLTEPFDLGAERVGEAIGYGLLGPGKRLRPRLTILTGRLAKAPQDAVLDVACAVEMVHAASLMLDDLPCMDDAKLRRGRPTTHLMFGEDVAILASVALLNRSYGVLAAIDVTPVARQRLLEVFATAIGSGGLVAGQAADLRLNDGDSIGSATLNGRKTGALFAMALRAGDACNPGPLSRSDHLRRIGASMGEVYQLRDDLLDATASSDWTGKDADQDHGRRNEARTHSPLATSAKLADLWNDVAIQLKGLGAEPIELAMIASVLWMP